MKLKNILSMGMALAMTAALAVPAFAADGDADAPKNVTEITGTYTETVIDVIVPAQASAVINPYGLGTTVTKSDGTTKVTVTGQVITPTQAIINNTDLNLTVGAMVVGSVVALPDGADPLTAMKLAATTTKGSGTEGSDDYVAPATAKSAFVQLQAVAAPASVMTAASTDPTDADTRNDAIIDAGILDATWADATTVTVGTKSVTEDELVSLKKATLDADDGSVTTYNAGSIALFRLTGDCVTSPKNAWTENDSFKVTESFTFAPAPATTPAP